MTTEMDAVFEQTVQVMRDAGAIVVDPVFTPSLDEYNASLSEIIGPGSVPGFGISYFGISYFSGGPVASRGRAS